MTTIPPEPTAPVDTSNATEHNVVGGPLFSVVIPTFNRPDSTQDAVESALTAPTGSVDVVVVDDGSTDGTATRVRESFGKRVHLIEQANAGRGRARNVGALASQGEWLVFLDSDDILVPGWLNAFAAMTAGADLVVSSSIRVSPVGKVQQVGPVDPVTNGLQAGAFAICRSIFDEIGGYCEALEHSEHTAMAFMLRRLDPGPRISTTSAPTVRIHDREGRYDPAVQLRTAEYLLEEFAPELDPDRHARSMFHGIAGVGAMKLGDRRSGRRHLGRALMDAPRPKALLRLLACCTPTRRDTHGS